MIAQLRGTAVAVGATWVVVEVAGFGVKVLCPPATAAAQRVGAQSTLSTSLVVREDSLTLYGFASSDERDCFELVQTASGIGPKIALAVVATLGADDLRAAVAGGNVAALTRVPGIGAKGAQRLILELKDKVGQLSLAGQASGVPGGWREQVKTGLEGLGWSSRDADAACDRVAALAETETSVAVLMRAALRTLAK
ncbi:MAG: Holliday junction branch migration protein RuvA [Propionicimonas sp.]|uniref:Holliday junction branch migration protein RuvA n=1 Tax=Propionicimonas sp. TaxID=1955623 RepID=UPI002B205620|nr:Holliday junction branch migration protein RuvA [Propionicimonas sp.]MEA4943094.1 Holliday junction branch migration protein RuvA [Propionicimonas sp.]MEA5054076.1 Holliday junction branch migration protein RuvA [Propionicimonas sp.]MEA5119214.1 Holliday junction branch migration protein RuvA [Propionicimonas sp.]